MAAQRNQQGLIDAIETNRDACGQARENFAASPWAERIRTVHQDVLTYEPEFPYDAIICNPPYYEDDLRSPDSARNMARHSEELSLEKLVEQCDRLLAVGGSVSCILPFERMSKLVELLTLNNLVISVVNNVKYVEGGPVRRVVLTLTRQRTQLRESTIEVQDTDNRYTDQYQQLTKDFLLKVRSD
jgi:tRNA1Val (adenine37-N6)-methyltransferase